MTQQEQQPQHFMAELYRRHERLMYYIVGSKIRLPSSCSMPLCKGSKPAQYSIREIFFIRLVSSCAILFASKVVEKL